MLESNNCVEGQDDRKVRSRCGGDLSDICDTFRRCLSIEMFSCPSWRVIARERRLPANYNFLSRGTNSRACAHYARKIARLPYCAYRAVLRERRSRDRNLAISRTFIRIALSRG
jgi:hypothetical protein